MSTPALDSILSTIQKLQRLAERAGTPDEAANAAAKVQALLFKHNLTLAQVDSHVEQPGAGDYENRTFTLEAGSFHIEWHRKLASVLARFNFCKMVQYGGSAKVGFIGQPHNIEVVTYLYGYLAREIKRLGLEAMRIHCDSTKPSQQGAWVRAFCLGAVNTIHTRLYAQRQQDERASAASTALVHVSDARLAQAVTRYFPKLHKAATPAPSRNAYANALGREAGARIALNKAVTGGSTTRRLGN